MRLTLLLLPLIFSVLSLGCSDDASATNPNDPSNLSLDILTYEDGSGIVVVSVDADNVTEFHYYMDDGSDVPHITTEGTYEYTYTNFGSYNVEVRAYGPSGRYIKKQQRITVIAAPTVDLDSGYSTPLSYDNMELVWNDEFTGSSLNTEFWSYDIGTGCPNLCGWGNNELEYYRTENLSVEEGVCKIEARKEDFDGSAYTSSKIVTRNKVSMHFGRIDIRATLPEGQGIWPALWMLGVNQPVVGWPKCGEIDIMEMVGGNGRENRITGNAFWDNNGINDQPKGYALENGIFADEFHVFSLIWTEEELRWYVDDVMFHSLDITIPSRSEFLEPFYIIFNVAVGGNFPGNPDATTSFPTKMVVDYVRVFKEI